MGMNYRTLEQLKDRIEEIESLEITLWRQQPIQMI